MQWRVIQFLKVQSDYLQDLIQHTQGLGNVDLIKVSGTDQETQINAIADDKSVIVSGTLASPIADFVGVFGMPNLGKLKTILSFDEYNETSKMLRFEKCKIINIKN